jgi:hypothetical protein
MIKKMWATAAIMLAGAMTLASPVAGAADWPPPLKPDPLYTVIDGTKVDPDTMMGFRTWRQAACDRCHGAEQQGLVGPSLLESLKTLTYEEFTATVKNGRLEKGMQSFGNSEMVMKNINNLYAYLKGRSDGKIVRAKVQEISAEDAK